jgi:hypothetical protein
MERPSLYVEFDNFLYGCTLVSNLKRMKRNFFALAFLLISVAAIPISTVISVQQKTETSSQQNPQWIVSERFSFTIKRGSVFESCIELTTVGLTSAPQKIQSTELLTIKRVLPIVTHRPFT